jgi:DNA-binding GntR family transcriptional regulator
MESVIVEEIAGMTGHNLDDLEAAMEAMRSAHAEGETIDFMLADTRLHVGLARGGGFFTSVTALEGLRDRVHLFRLQQPLTEEQMHDVIDEHSNLLNAIDAGDPDAAVDRLRVHLGRTRSRIDAAAGGERQREPELTLSRSSALD